MRLRRSVLMSPATRPERVEKALREGRADTVVADLEDGIPPGKADEARQAVAKVLQAVPTSRSERGVRIHPFPSAQADQDLAAVLPAAPDVLMVPKAHDAAALRALAKRLDEAEARLGLARGKIQLMPLVETAAGVMAAAQLAACPRVAAIALGAEDLAADAGLRRSASNAEVSVPRAWLALACAAARVQAIDMVTVDFRDAQRTAAEAREARALGYAGKMVLHPIQVEAVHAALRPTAEELAWARKVDAAARAAGAEAGGVVVVDGSMVDAPVVAQARQVLMAADAP